MESQILMKKSLLVDLSEQQLLDCDSNDGSCAGGDPFMVMNWMINNPVTLDKYYQYNARASVCKTNATWPKYSLTGQTLNYYLGGRGGRKS